MWEGMEKNEWGDFSVGQGCVRGMRWRKMNSGWGLGRLGAVMGWIQPSSEGLGGVVARSENHQKTMGFTMFLGSHA